jgi:hypothetical protein
VVSGHRPKALAGFIAAVAVAFGIGAGCLRVPIEADHLPASPPHAPEAAGIPETGPDEMSLSEFSASVRNRPAGAEAVVHHEDRVLVFRQSGLVIRDESGTPLVTLSPTRTVGVESNGEIRFDGIYGPGSSLSFHPYSDRLDHALILDASFPLPAGAGSLEMTETMVYSRDLIIQTEEGEAVHGQPTETPGWLNFVTPGGRVAFHVPTPSAWDESHLDIPWMTVEVHPQGAGHATLTTKVPLEWLNDPARQFPVSIDPSVSPAEPPPILGPLFLAPVVPGSLTYVASGSFTNHVHSDMVVKIVWGDGDSIVIGPTTWPFSEIHTYPAPGQRRVTIRVSSYEQPDKAVSATVWIFPGV